MNGIRILNPERPKSKTLLKHDEEVISPSLARSGTSIYATRGEGCYLEDADGNVYLDFAAGIAVSATGYKHEGVNAAIKAQVDQFLHLPGTSTGFGPFSQLSAKLAALFPSGTPNGVFLTNSGTEAMEAAIKLVRAATKRPYFISFFGGFHGRTTGALALTASKTVQKRGFSPYMPGVHHVPYANCRHCPVNLSPNTCDVECARYMEDYLFAGAVPPDEVGAIVFETVQGEGGYVIPPKKFFDYLVSLRERYGILLVADEIQAGMGRTGKMFAFEHFDFVPDIVCVGKGIASGLPLGAIIARRELMTWEKGSHASTFGGNPVACAAALKTIELLQTELTANAAAMGAHFVSSLKQQLAGTPGIGDVRGLGLMVAIEFVEPGTHAVPAPTLRDRFLQSCLSKGLLALGCGKSVARLTPPLIVTANQINEAVAVIALVCKELAR